MKTRKGADSELVFVGLSKPANNSVIRAYVFDKGNVKVILNSLEKMGCEVEIADNPCLLAANVPPHVDFDRIIKYLIDNSAILDYDEASLRHGSTPT